MKNCNAHVNHLTKVLFSAHHHKGIKSVFFTITQLTGYWSSTPLFWHCYMIVALAETTSFLVDACFAGKDRSEGLTRSIMFEQTWQIVNSWADLPWHGSMCHLSPGEISFRDLDLKLLYIWFARCLSRFYCPSLCPRHVRLTAQYYIWKVLLKPVTGLSVKCFLLFMTNHKGLIMICKRTSEMCVSV